MVSWKSETLIKLWLEETTVMPNVTLGFILPLDNSNNWLLELKSFLCIINVNKSNDSDREMDSSFLSSSWLNCAHWILEFIKQCKNNEREWKECEILWLDVGVGKVWGKNSEVLQFLQNYLGLS